MLIDSEENRTLRPVLVAMLREGRQGSSRWLVVHEPAPHRKVAVYNTSAAGPVRGDRVREHDHVD